MLSSISIQIGVVNNILDDAFKTSNEGIIEKIVELTSNRRDIMAKIVAKNKETVEQLLGELKMKDGDRVDKTQGRRAIAPGENARNHGHGPQKRSKTRLEKEMEDLDTVEQILPESKDKNCLRKTSITIDVAPKKNANEQFLPESNIDWLQSIESNVKDENHLGKTSTTRGVALKESTKKLGRPPKISNFEKAKEAQKRGCTVWLERTNYQTFGDRSAIITQGSVPDDFLPLNLENFEALDSQGPAEEVRKPTPYVPKIIKPLKTKGRRLCAKSQKLN